MEKETETEKENDRGEEGPTSDESPYERKRMIRRVERNESLPFTLHLEELRWRLIYCAYAIGVSFAFLYAFSEPLFLFFSKPMGDYPLIALAPTEAFFAYLTISFYSALILSMPVIFYQTWEFVAPGLLDKERRYTGWFVLSGSLFFLLGGAFCYFLVLPYGLNFLLGYAGDTITPTISVGNYISFLFKLLIAFGLIFQLPLVLVTLTRLGVVTPDWLADKRPYFVVGSFVVAAILTPPDVFTQAIMAGPMIILYEVSLLVARIFAHDDTKESP